MLLVVVVESRSEFGDSDGSGAEFSDHDPSGSVCEMSSIGQGGPCRNGEREDAEDGVACAGNIKNLTAAVSTLNAGLTNARVHFRAESRNVKFLGRILFKNVHSLLSTGNHKGSRTEMRQERMTSFLD